MNKQNELISVIVPIYKVEDYLDQCISSIILQTYHNLEIILVDNGSPDRCPEICDKYAQIDARIKVIHQPNAGLVNARKVGLAASSGGYVAYVDGDDWVEPEMYETLFRAMKKSDADIVVAGHKEDLCGRTESLLNIIDCGIYQGDELVDEVYKKMLCSGKFSQFGIYSYVWNKLFKRGVLYQNQMQVDEHIFIGEDAACTYPSLLNANIVCIIDSDHYHYRQRVDSMVKTLESGEHESECISILYHYLKQIFVQSPYADYLLPQLDSYVLSLITVRSSCLLCNDDNLTYLFPFSKVKNGCRIILCGAGTFGQHVYRRLITNAHFHCVLWVDPNYRQYQECKLPVQELNEILDVEYDFVVICYIDETIADTARNILLDMGVDAEKIAWIDYDFTKTSEILKEIILNKWEYYE